MCWRLLFLRPQILSDSHNGSQIIRLPQQLSMTIGFVVGRMVLFQITATELSYRPVQVGEGVDRNLHVGPDTNKGHLAGSRVMDRLTVEGCTDSC